MSDDRKKRSPMSKETKKKLSKARIGIKRTPDMKPVGGQCQSAETHKKINAANAANNRVKRLVEAESLDYLREALTRPDAKGLPYYKKYIDAFLNNALTEPDGLCSRMLGLGLFSDKTLAKLDQESKDLMNKDREFAVYRLRKTLFDKQQEVFDDDFDKKIIVICSRRSGKTECNARKILKVVLKGNRPVLYLNKTFENAVRQLFDIVVDLAGQCEIPISRASKAEGFIEFTNGSSVKFGGVNDIAKIDSYRGYSFCLVICDEIQSLKNQKILIDEVLTPATADYADSQMIFTGTPPRSRNYANELWESNIKKFTWTFLDNPFIPNAKEFLDQVLKEKNLTMNDPYIQREYCGNMYAFDTESLIFPKYSTITPDDFKDIHIDDIFIGVDFGFQDYNGIVTLACDNDEKKAYVIEESKFNKAGFDEIGNRVNAHYLHAIDFFNKHRKLSNSSATDHIKVVTDTNEPALAFDLQDKYHLPVEKAYKYDKMGSFAATSDACREGHIIILKDGPLENEFKSAIYKRDERDVIINEIDDDAYHPDIIDALRYAYRQVQELWQCVKPAANMETLNTTRPAVSPIDVYDSSESIPLFSE